MPTLRNVEACEAAIGARLDAGDLAGAVTEAVSGYGPQLLGYLVTLLRDGDAAREVFADACEDIWRGVGGFRRETSFRAWAYRIVWNAAQEHLRDPYRRRGRRLESEEISQLVASVRTETPPHGRTSVREAVLGLRERLGPEDQSLLTLRVHRGLSFAEIAAVLSSPGFPMSEATARKRFERAKGRLRELAAEDGLLR